MDKKDLGKNIRYLCSRYKSISEVCRRLEINRQQFNRYLAGEQTPSLYTLSRIAAFFEVGLEEIQLRHEDFRARVVPGQKVQGQRALPKDLMRRVSGLLTKPMPQIGDFEGLYYRYYYSFGFRGMVIRTLFSLKRQGDFYVTKHIERIPRSQAPGGFPATFKYDGIVLYLSGRLFVLEYDTLLESTICEMIMAPVSRPGARLLSGVHSSITTGTGNEPTCTRVVLEYLGQQVDLRGAMRNCGLIDPAAGEIDPAILALIKNNNRADAFTFRARRIEGGPGTR